MNSDDIDGLRHYEIIGDGIAVLKPESLRGDARFRESLRRMKSRMDAALDEAKEGTSAQLQQEQERNDER